MNCKSTKKLIFLTVSIMVVSSLLLGGCTQTTPLNPQPQQPPTQQPQQPGSNLPGQIGQTTTITYNYGDTDKVQLSANNITLKVGDKLILQPAPGLTKTTRFTSSGENFFGDIMKQDAEQPNSGRAEFTAIKAGKGKLQIIPNTTDVDRAVDLWVTVQ